MFCFLLLLFLRLQNHLKEKSLNENYQEYRPINLLFYEILKDAINNNFKVFDFGIFTVNEEPNMGLAKFKENFGSSGIFRDTLAFHF